MNFAPVLVMAPELSQNAMILPMASCELKAAPAGAVMVYILLAPTGVDAEIVILETLFTPSRDFNGPLVIILLQLDVR